MMHLFTFTNSLSDRDQWLAHKKSFRKTALRTFIMVFLLLVSSYGASPGLSASAKSVSQINYGRPVLAFYYPWYNHQDWCKCHMSDLPTVQYNSSDDATIERQIQWAKNAGITGFISSWWG